MKFQLCAKFFGLTELDNHIQDFIRKTGCDKYSEAPDVFQFSTKAYLDLLNPCRGDEQLTTSSITSGVADLDMEVEIPSIKTEDIRQIPAQKKSPVKTPSEILNSTVSSTTAVSSTTSACTDPTINPINELQEYCVKNNIYPTYDINFGHDGLYEVVCKVSTGDAKTAFHTEEKRAKILAAKEMLEMLTNEKIELEECDEFNNYKTMFVESVQYLKQRLKKRGKGNAGKPLPLPEHDPKSCFNLLSSNYPSLISGLEMTWEDVGVNSHCTFFKYSGSAKITVYVGDSLQQYGTSVKVTGRHGVKKASEKVTHAKLLIAAVKAIKEIQESKGRVLFEPP